VSRILDIKQIVKALDQQFIDDRSKLGRPESPFLAFNILNACAQEGLYESESFEKNLEVLRQSVRAHQNFEE